MRIILSFILVCLTVLGSCSRKQNIDASAARKWSVTSDAQRRDKVAVYGYQRPDSSWVYISTAKLTVASSGVVADNGEILTSGYLVYPGGKQVSNIHEAIEEATNVTQGIAGDKRVGR